MFSQKWRQSAYRTIAVVAGIAAAGSLGGCGAAASGSGTDLTLSGTFSTSGASQAIEKLKNPIQRGLFSIVPTKSALQVEDYSIYNLVCSDTKVPPDIETGTVNSDGSFSLSVTNGLKQGLNCNVTNASSGAFVATLIIKDPDHKDMNGNPSVNSTPGYTSSQTQLGSILLDILNTDAYVTASNVVGSSGSSALLTQTEALTGTPLDFTGTYIIGDVDFTPPPGYRKTCTSAEQQSQSCNGPSTGIVLYVNRFQGVNTADNSAVYALQVWQDGGNGNSGPPGIHPIQAAEQCGPSGTSLATGLSSAQETALGVSFASSGLADQIFNFGITITDSNSSYPTDVCTSATGLCNTPGSNPGTVGFTGGYKMADAYAQYSQQPGGSVVVSPDNGVTEYSAWVQGPDTNGYYQFMLGGGCVLASDGVTPVNNTSWPMSCSGNPQPTAISGDITGFYTLACTGDVTINGNQTSVTCSNQWGTFSSAALNANLTPTGTAEGPNAFNWNSMVPLSQMNELCSSMPSGTDAQQVAQAQCYVDYWQQNGQGASGCYPRVNQNWSGNTLADFIQVDFRPNNMIFMDKFNYVSTTAGTLLTEQDEYQGVQIPNSSGTSYVNCAVHEKDGLSVTADPSNNANLIATYSAFTTTSSTDAACLAQYNNKVNQFIFTLTATTP